MGSCASCAAMCLARDAQSSISTTGPAGKRAVLSQLTVPALSREFRTGNRSERTDSRRGTLRGKCFKRAHPTQLDLDVVLNHFNAAADSVHGGSVDRRPARLAIGSTPAA